MSEPTGPKESRQSSRSSEEARKRPEGVVRESSGSEGVEEALRRSDERFRKIFDHSNDAIFVIDPESDKILDVNKSACKMLGYSKDELIVMPVSAIHPEEMPKLMEFSQSVFERGHGWTNELSCLTKSGATLPSEMSASVIEVSGRSCILAMIRDITDRKRAENALRESENRLFQILESAMDAIITYDQKGRVTLFNSAAEKVFRCNGDYVCGQPVNKLLDEGLGKLVRDIAETLDSKTKKQPHQWIPAGMKAKRADGEVFLVEGTLSEVEVGGQRVTTMILRDINERKKAEEALRQLQLANVYLQEEIKTQHNFEEIIGSSRALKKALQNVEKVAETESTVLLIGETGTGKELFARAIHDLSKRRDRVLIRVNCAALPAGLIESELFGHEKGAFTGAISKNIGRFELADGGTIFLDEIGDLPHDIQVKLLRVLQEKEFERVGGTRTIGVDVRIIAATNRDLQKLVKENTFRPDLYYRLNVFPILLPPLRDRKEDLKLLAQYFVNKHEKKMGRKIEKISPDALKRLLEYPWPGNIRELENVIERAMILAKGPDLEIDEGLLPPLTESGEMTRFQTLEETERDHVLKALDKTHGVIDGPNGAATILGLHPNTLRSRMQKMGIKKTGH